MNGIASSISPPLPPPLPVPSSSTTTTPFFSLGLPLSSNQPNQPNQPNQSKYGLHTFPLPTMSSTVAARIALNTKLRSRKEEEEEEEEEEKQTTTKKITKKKKKVEEKPKQQQQQQQQQPLSEKKSVKKVNSIAVVTSQNTMNTNANNNNNNENGDDNDNDDDDDDGWVVVENRRRQGRKIKPVTPTKSLGNLLETKKTNQSTTAKETDQMLSLSLLVLDETTRMMTTVPVNSPVHYVIQQGLEYLWKRAVTEEECQQYALCMDDNADWVMDSQDVLSTYHLINNTVLRSRIVVVIVMLIVNVNDDCQ